MSARAALSLTITAEMLAALRASLFTADGAENFAVLYCAVAETTHGTRLLAREMLPAPPSAYRERLADYLEIAPSFFSATVDRALTTGLHPVIVHSHPHEFEANYSAADDSGERRLLPVLSQLLPGRYIASLLLTPHELQGRTVHDGEFCPMTHVEVMGDRIDIFERNRADSRAADDVITAEMHERQMRAIGADGMERIRRLRVGVIGAGGTGSAVLEQLARLGVNDIAIVDPDVLAVSNLSRVWGSTPDDAERVRPKVDVLAQHLQAIAPGIRVRGHQESVVRQSVLRELRDRQLLFGCTDNHWSRAVLNRFAHQYLIPLVDMGVRLDARSGQTSAAAGQVTLVGPGLSCLRCSGLISPDRVRVESMPVAERLALEREGYVAGVDEPAPAVISLNTAIAGMAVTAALSLFVNLTGARPAAGLRYDAQTGTTFTVMPRHEAHCDVCSTDAGVIALGDLQTVSAYE